MHNKHIIIRFMNNESFKHLHSELSVLVSAVAYTNLSDAADHIAVSQPQLSRIVSKLENVLRVSLLDRSIKRKSSWTPIAHELAQFFMKHERRFETEIHELINGIEITHLRVGTLEGLSELAMNLCKSLLTNSELKILELDLYDLNDLDKHFSTGDLDLIFTIREPQRKKLKFRKRLGFQTIKWVNTNSNYLTLSPFEYGTKIHHKWKVAYKKIFISNSLKLRGNWLEQFGGTGSLPARELHSKKNEKSDEEVLLLGAEHLSSRVWEKIIEIKL